MNKQALWAIVRKDILSIRNNVQVWLPIVILPVVFCLLIPAGLLLAVQRFDVQALGNVQPILKLLEELPPGNLRRALLQWDTLEQQVSYLFLVYLFAPFFLLIPLMISSVVAAHSFVGEKERKTLESLLYTPIDMASLFWGKLLSALLPAIAITLICALGYALVVNLVGLSLFGRFILPQANWIVLIIWVVPAISLFAIFLNVSISARVKGFQEAYQLGGLVVLPVLALFISQMTGVLFLDLPVLFVLGAVLLLLDLLMVRFTIRQFDRDRLFATQVR